MTQTEQTFSEIFTVAFHRETPKVTINSFVPNGGELVTASQVEEWNEEERNDYQPLRRQFFTNREDAVAYAEKFRARYDIQDLTA